MTKSYLVADDPRWSATDYSDDIAKDYEAFSKEAFSDSYKFQANIALAFADLEQEGSSVLEIGCGPGRLGLLIKSKKPKVKLTLTDHSEHMVRIAARFAQNSGSNDTELSVEDAQCLSFDDDTFDLVVSQFMLRHVPDPVKALDEAFRVLKPGGLVYFTDVVMAKGAVKKRLIDEAPGQRGREFITAALDSAHPKEVVAETVASCSADKKECLFGGIGGYPPQSRELLDLIKRGFSTSLLKEGGGSSEWSRKISPYWAHIYLRKDSHDKR